eukprot:8810184-Pyramimonas_sp.AAC.1
MNRADAALSVREGADVGWLYDLFQDQHRGLELEAEGFHAHAGGRTAGIPRDWAVVGGSSWPGHGADQFLQLPV